MTTSTFEAEDAIICELCDKPAQRYCTNCQARLSLDCVTKHLQSLIFVSHEIVPFHNEKSQLLFPACEFHSDMTCFVRCEQCETPVCSECLFGLHEGHDSEDIASLVQGKKEEIQKETEEIELKLIPEYHAAEADIHRKLLKAEGDYAMINQENKILRNLWHREVDDIFDKFDSLIHSLKDNDIEILTTYQTKVNKLLLEMIETIERNKEILMSNIASEVTQHKSKLKEYKNIPTPLDVTTPSLATHTMQGRKLSIEIEGVEATLTQTAVSGSVGEMSFFPTRTLLQEAKVIATIPVDCKPLFRVECVGWDEAWIFGDQNIITRLDLRGSVKDTIMCENNPRGISLTKQGDLLYSDSTNRTVNIVQQGRSDIVHHSEGSHVPWGICCTKSGDILVSVRGGKKMNRIFRYQRDKIIFRYNKDERGKHLFGQGTYMLYVSESRNGDVCVSDRNAKSVIVMQSPRKVRFRYYGSLNLKDKLRSFDPGCIVSDSYGHILVIDINNACLHILDQNGSLLKYVDNCELDKPCGLSVDKGLRLWVGLHDAGEIKVIEYLQ